MEHPFGTEETYQLGIELIADATEEIRLQRGDKPKTTIKRKIGDIVNHNGNPFKITGFEDDGTPIGDPVEQ